jgi:tetratricopeptide (TPR) repeat protein
MRRLFLAAILAAVPAAAAEIRTPDQCTAAIAADPAAAREAAAVWHRTGGGVPARLCEASALAAMGAHGTAAQLLGNLAANPNRVMMPGLRAVILTDGAGQWLAAGRPDLAAAALAEASRIAAPDADGQLLLARVAAAQADWPAARVALDAALADRPDDALAHALLAATLRNQGEPAAALAEAERALALAPDLPEALFEAGAALAETGQGDRAAQVWLQLIAAQPDSDLAALARTNLQRLN